MVKTIDKIKEGRKSSKRIAFTSIFFLNLFIILFSNGNDARK